MSGAWSRLPSSSPSYLSPGQGLSDIGFWEKAHRPRRGGRGWDVEWGPLRSPFVLWWKATRATTRVPTQPFTTPAPTGTRPLSMDVCKKPILEAGEGEGGGSTTTNLATHG